MTLPSRLKVRNSSRETLDQLVNALNVNGNQNIAKLRMSIDQTKALNGHSRPVRREVGSQSSDARMPSQDRRADEPHSGEEEVSTFDMEFFPAESFEQNRGRRNPKKPHVFGQAESHRVSEDATKIEATEEDDGFERARRRAAGLPIIKQSVYPIFFLEVFAALSNIRCIISRIAADPSNFSLGAKVFAGQVLADSMTPAGREHPCRFPC